MTVTDWQILEGDCRDMLRTFPAQSVHTVVTSPPYFGLRDYSTAGQIGLEPTPDEFVAALVAVFAEVRRVLRDDGTVWLNLGDSYAVNGGARSYGSTDGATGRATAPGQQRQALTGYKPKDLLGIPWMVAFALRADGWYLRSDIIWSKPNPMPESVTDRPTKAHEYVFLLSKGPRYFYDTDAIREEHQSAPLYDMDRAVNPKGHPNGHGGHVDKGGSHLVPGAYHVAGRNKRSVWTVTTQPYAGAHFATFPSKLIEPCILAGSPECACGECGAPWVRVSESRRVLDGDTPVSGAWSPPVDARGSVRSEGATGVGHWRVTTERQTVGWEPSCSHADDCARGVVLDPFCGAATTGLVAAQHGRDFIGIELSPKYAALGRERIETFVRLGFRSPNGNGHIAPEQDTLFEGIG